MLYESVIEDRRTHRRATATSCAPLDAANAEQRLRSAFARGIRACAIVLMHGYRFPAHEQRARGNRRDASASRRFPCRTEVSPLIKLVSRGDTTVADAYLSPVLRRYVDRVAAALPGTRLQFMQSNGGLARRAAHFAARTRCSPGPPAASSAPRARARAPASTKIIGFDMGGTSTDVSHYAGEYERALRRRGGGRAAAHADPAHPHGRGRRRFDLPLRRRAAARRPRIRRRRSRARPAIAAAGR